MVKARKFPCPYCKGQGGELEVVIPETGQGPYYECGFCSGDGMIVVDSPLHEMLRENKRQRGKDEET